jgi:hypothetical protein
MDREIEVVSLASNEVQMVPILTCLVGDKFVIRKNCLCFRAAVSELHTRHTRNKQRRHPPPPPLTPQPTKHNIVAIVAKETNHLTARTTIHLSSYLCFSGCGGCYNDDSQSITMILVRMDVAVL